MTASFGGVAVIKPRSHFDVNCVNLAASKGCAEICTGHIRWPVIS